jgi:hypothetical protein
MASAMRSSDGCGKVSRSSRFATHRLQLVIHDAILWRDAQQKAKAAATKQVPPVQRPGVSQPRGAARDAQIQNLSKRLETSGSLKDAAALLRARRAAR